MKMFQDPKACDQRAATPEGSPLRRKLRVLRLLIEIPESEAPFQQFSLPKMHEYDITLCTVFKSVSDVPKPIRLFEGDGTVRGYMKVLRRALRDGPYDIVHAHSPHVGYLYMLLAIWQPSLLRGTLMTVHNTYNNTKFRNKILLTTCFFLFRRIVCCGQATYESFPRFIRWFAGHRYDVVVNGVDIERIDRVLTDSPVNDHASEFTITSACRLVPIKNLPTTLSAFELSSDPTSRLVFMGSGVDAEKLVEQARLAGIEHRVEFPGMLPREEVYRRLAGSDIFISASYGEGLPIAVLEAMACGCPVILSDIASHREIARGADFIPLVAADDVDGFAREINRLQSMSPGQRAKIGERCRQIVRETFSLDSMLDGYDRIFQELVTT